MKHPPDYASRHDYEVKRVHKVHTDGAISERQPVGSEVLDRYGFNPIRLQSHTGRRRPGWFVTNAL